MRLFLLVLLFWSGSIQAQNKAIDSLMVALLSAKTDSAKVELNYALSRQYSYTDAKKARAHAKAAEQLATAIGFAAGRAKALNQLGSSHLVMGEYDKALDCHFEALRIGEQTADTTVMMAAYNNLGVMYHKMNDPARAIKNYTSAAELALHSNNKLGLSKAYNNLGNTYESEGEYKKAFTYYSKAAALQEEVGDKRTLAVIQLNIGNLYLFFDRPEEGLPYLFQSLRLNNEIHNEVIQIATLRSIAKIYKAIEEPQEALKYAHQSYTLALKTESSKKISESAQLMHELYASIKDYEQAYKYLGIYVQHNNNLDLESQKRVAAEATAKYETEKRELENQRLKAEKEIQATELAHQHNSLILESAIILLLFVLLVVLFFSRKKMKRTFLELKDTHAKMQAQHLKINTQNEELAKHNSFKNKIFSIISHDLRSPLTSIKSILNLVHKRPMTDSEVKHIFGLLGKDTDVAMNMLNNVLMWAKAQLEHSSIKGESVSLAVMAEENIQLLSTQAAQKNITITNTVSETAVALADIERLNFVLRNLLMNAIKFTYQGGEIVVKTEDGANDTVVLQVSDNGKGISPAHLSKLFAEERFTSLGTLNEKGTGLGLMLSKEFIQSLNGSIGVESELGKGSTFSIVLPKPSAQATELKEAEHLVLS